MSTETSLPVLLTNQGAVEPQQMTRVRHSVANKNSSAIQSPESSAEVLEIVEQIPHGKGGGGQCESAGVIVCYYSGWSSGCLRLVA